MARILIVDDQDAILKTLEAILKTAGYDVIKASDGYIAIERIQMPLDLVITDVKMPGVSGYDLVRAIRMGENTKHLPVIMLTSRNYKRDVERAIHLKADDYIIKPMDPEVVLAKVASALKDNQKGPEVQLAGSEPGEVKVTIKITSVTLSNVTYESTQSMPIGARFNLTNPLFKKIGIEGGGPSVRVLSCLPHPKGFVLSAQFADLSAKDKEAIKKWVEQNSAKKTA